MRIGITLKNYRCFPDSSPAHFEINEGWVAFLGVNNSGKSSLLRFFHEFRNFFQLISTIGNWTNIGRGGKFQMNFAACVKDPLELFYNGNTRPLTIEITVIASDDERIGFSEPHPVSLRFEMSREFPNYFQLVALVIRNDIQFPIPDNSAITESTILISSVGGRVEMNFYLEAAMHMGNSLYIGAFRNVLNTGAKLDYYDIQVGDAFVKRWRQMQSGDNKRDNKACIDVVSAIEQLFGFDRLEIQPAAQDETLHVVINQHSYKLPELGSGIAQFILALANVAARRPSYIMIDEPELNFASFIAN